MEINMNNYWIIILTTMFSSAQGQEPEYISIYRRVPQRYLKAMPQKVFEHTTVEACARSCVIETEFECKSFDYDNGHRECHLHNHTHLEPLIGLQEALDVDHYRTAYEKLFNRIPNHVITMKHKRKIRGLRIEECARRCIQEMTFRCAGFDYGKPSRVCLLTNKVPADVGGLKRRANTDYYERKTNGPLSRFINYGYGSLQTIEGVQTHTKIVLGVNLDACAQLCLAETAFECTSFDYVFGEQSCQLSKYIAAHVHGMRTEFEKRYKVMHFELIDEYLNYFYPTPYASITERNDKTFRKVTPDTCARRCLEERDFVCRSFDYQIQKGTCLLSHVTGSDAGGLYTLEGVHVHHFEMKPSLDCGGIFQRERGTIASPNWPRYYSHHLNCTWSIFVPEFKIIRLEIHHVDLGNQGHNACAADNDILSITEHTSSGNSMRCVQNYETEVTSQTNNVNLTFLTNADNDAQGFRLFFYADWPCEAILTKDNGEFASPRWPNKYPAMLNCRWTIKGPPGSQVVLRLNSVQLEDHTGSNCRTAYDRIDIYNGDSNSDRHLITVCGLKSSLSFTSSGSTMLVTFTSDSRVQAKGFHASYRFIYQTTTTTTSTHTPSTTITSTVSKLPLLINKNPHSTDETATKLKHANRTNASSNNATGSNSNETGHNNSMSVHLAMVGGLSSEEDDSNLLEAEFSEPPPYLIHAKNKTKSRNKEGKISDDIGMGIRPDIRLDIIQSEKGYTAIIWGVVLSICSTCLIMTIVMFVVCRYYRRRLPKHRKRPNRGTNPDENLSLCQKEGDTHDHQSGRDFPDEEEIEDAARLPLPGDHTAPPDVEFHNPLYLDCPAPRSDRPTSLVLDNVVMATSDLDPSSNTNIDSQCRPLDDQYACAMTPGSDFRNSLSDIESSVLSEDTTSTALLLEDRPRLHMDCFTTV